MAQNRTLLTVVAILGAPLCGAQLVEATPLQDTQAAGVTDASPRPLDLRSLADAPPPIERVGDGRRTMGHFMPNLGRNLIGVLSPANARPLLFGAALTAAGSQFDAGARSFFAQKSRSEEFGELGQTIGGATVMGPATLGLFLAGRASHDSRFRAATYDGLQATLVAGTYTSILKRAVGRPRPDGSSNLSFPSGHTSQAFAWAAVIDHHYGRRSGLAAYTLAGLIGVSRLERQKHNLSDVLAGATLGWVAGRTVVGRNDEAPRSSNRFTLVPMSDPSGGGVGLGAHLSF